MLEFTIIVLKLLIDNLFWINWIIFSFYEENFSDYYNNWLFRLVSPQKLI